nr:TSUP family transporter [uncultured Schaedlerella sp.]
MRTLRISNTVLCVLIGAALGAMSTFLGIGGGPINLVVLFYFFSMDTKTTPENSLYIIFFSQIASLISSIVTKSISAFSIRMLVMMVLCGIGGGDAGTLHK